MFWWKLIKKRIVDCNFSYNLMQPESSLFIVQCIWSLILFFFFKLLVCRFCKSIMFLQVKSCLNKESYVTFSKALGMYKKTGQLSQAVGVMAGLFTENPQDYHLFRSMFLFDLSFYLKYMYTLVRSKSETYVFLLYCLMHM